ncbi:hypothetical protein TO66_15210 [Pseudomonas sp. MRSN 12121]|nr:hypothetical protein TO66_15210 [Pseudomonas sp. MRSN 12121]
MWARTDAWPALAWVMTAGSSSADSSPGVTGFLSDSGQLQRIRQEFKRIALERRRPGTGDSLAAREGGVDGAGDADLWR